MPKRAVHNNPKVDKDDLDTYLPSEILLNIFLRLLFLAITCCKCVCKSWLDILTSREFVKFHLSRSIPGLSVLIELETHSKQYRIIECVDESHRWNVVYSFYLPFRVPLHSSVNGLLFLSKPNKCIEDIFICNPITREYIHLPSPQQQHFSNVLSGLTLVSYGFGVSRKSGQYKVVRGFYKRTILHDSNGFCFDQLFECLVYTVGTGSWRRIVCGGGINTDQENSLGTFLNGNLHWFEDTNERARALARTGTAARISCLDLETETFSAFSPPPSPSPSMTYRILSVLGDYLCLCETSRITNDRIDIWLMKKYGDDKSWTKEFMVMRNHPYYGYVRPIKVFKDGDIVMELQRSTLLHYSNTTKTIREIDVTGSENVVSSFCTTIYAPSFVSLKSFAMEMVSNFDDF